MIDKTDITETARLWVIRINSEDLSDAERAEFSNWYNANPSHKLAFENEQENWDVAEALKAAFKPASEIDKTTSPLTKNVPHSHHLQTKNGWMKAAAIFAFMTILGLYSWSNHLMILAQADAVSSTGEQKQIDLPDGSLALLNTNSAIKISYTETERKIEILKGEVFFKVRSDKNHPFRVVANDGSAKAVGTAYSVRKVHEHMTVTVTEGTVSVSSKDQEKSQGHSKSTYLLGRGHQIHFGQQVKSEITKNVDFEKQLAWRKGKIIFDNTPIGEAIIELGRYYPGRIIVAKQINKSKRVSGVFPSDKASSAIKAIARSNGLTAKETVKSLLLVIY